MPVPFGASSFEPYAPPPFHADAHHHHPEPLPYDYHHSSEHHVDHSGPGIEHSHKFPSAHEIKDMHGNPYVVLATALCQMCQGHGWHHPPKD